MASVAICWTYIVIVLSYQQADEKMNERQCEVLLRIAVQTCLFVSLYPGVKYYFRYVSHILHCIQPVGD